MNKNDELVQLHKRASQLRRSFVLAKAREDFKWLFGYSSFLWVGTLGRFAFSGRFPKMMLMPLSALSTYTLYMWDIGYGSHYMRVNRMAQYIMVHETQKLSADQLDVM